MSQIPETPREKIARMELEGRSCKIEPTIVPDIYVSVPSDPFRESMNDSIISIPIDHSKARHHAEKIIPSTTSSASKDDLLPNPLQTQTQVASTTRKRPVTLLLLTLFLIQILLLCGAEYFLSLIVASWVPPRRYPEKEEAFWIREIGAGGPHSGWMKVW